MQKQKPLPVRPLLSRPLPTQHHPQQPRQPLSPAPKTAQGRYRAEQLTDAELADYARRIVAVDTEINRLLGKVAELRRQQVQAINEIRLGSNPGIIEECSNCHGHHTGSCNA